MAHNRAETLESAHALDAWLRANLGRRLTLAFVRAHANDAVWPTLYSELARYQEIRLLTPTPSAEVIASATQQPPQWEAVFRQALQEDTDALLVWYDADDAGANTQPAYLHAITQAADALNIFDRMTLALIGPGTTRAIARAHGFEDGYTFNTATGREDTLAMLTALARSTLDAEAYRRRGSSPPCYL